MAGKLPGIGMPSCGPGRSFIDVLEQVIPVEMDMHAKIFYKKCISWFESAYPFIRPHNSGRPFEQDLSKYAAITCISKAV